MIRLAACPRPRLSTGSRTSQPSSSGQDATSDRPGPCTPSEPSSATTTTCPGSPALAPTHPGRPLRVHDAQDERPLSCLKSRLRDACELRRVPGPEAVQAAPTPDLRVLTAAGVAGLPQPGSLSKPHLLGGLQRFIDRVHTVQGMFPANDLSTAYPQGCGEGPVVVARTGTLLWMLCL